MIEFSIIIPVYNVEKYLSKCLDSVIAQSYTNWEAVCINDGSQDSSLQILEEYAKKDERIKIISQDNQGQAVARNVGIKESKGNWLLFVDSDDFIRSDALEFLNRVIEDNKLDAISFETDILYEGDCRERDNKDFGFFKYHDYPYVISGIKLFEDMMRNNEYCGSACLLALNETFVKNHNLFFYKGIYYEDSLFCIDVFMKASRMLHIHEKLYTYRVREASTMTCRPTKDHIRSRIIVFRELMKIVYSNECSNSAREQLLRYATTVADDIKRIDKRCVTSDELILDEENDFIASILDVCRYKTTLNNKMILCGIEAVIKDSDEWIIYGAGKVGRLMLNFLSSRGLKDRIRCFMVTKMYESAKSIQGIPVCELKENKNNDASIMLCVMNRIARQDIIQSLKDKGYKQIELCDEDMYLALENYAL